MSGKISGAVWDMALPQNEKYVLLAYADHADHEGRGVRPGYQLVAWKTGYSVRHVQHIVRKLEEKGILILEIPGGNKDAGTLGKPNEWRIDIDAAPMSPKRKRGGRVIPTSPQGDTQNTHMRVISTSPKSSVEPSTQPLNTFAASQQGALASELDDLKLTDAQRLHFAAAQLALKGKNPDQPDQAAIPDSVGDADKTPSKVPPKVSPPEPSVPNAALFSKPKPRAKPGEGGPYYVLEGGTAIRFATYSAASKHGGTITQTLPDGVEAVEPPALTPGIKNELARICYGSSAAWAVPAQAKAMGKTFREIGKVPTVEELQRFEANWIADDFRGKRGDRPEPYQVANNWTKYTEIKHDDSNQGRATSTNGSAVASATGADAGHSGGKAPAASASVPIPPARPRTLQDLFGNGVDHAGRADRPSPFRKDVPVSNVQAAQDGSAAASGSAGEVEQRD